MKHFFPIALFALVISLFYSGVAQVLPQLENRPPPEIKAGADISAEELSEAGLGVFEANCVQCHKLGQVARGPDLAVLGTVMSSRISDRGAAAGKNYGDVDYLVESLCKPGDYVVSGFGNIMPPQGKALTGGQILAVTAFLQNLSGEATLKGTDTAVLDKFGCGGGGAAGATVAAATASVGPPEDVFSSFGCSTCHAIDNAERKLGPSLQGAGKRLGKGGLWEGIMAPDATMAVGTPPYPAGLMKQTLEGNGFYSRMSPVDYHKLVDWLATK